MSATSVNERKPLTLKLFRCTARPLQLPRRCPFASPQPLLKTPGASIPNPSRPILERPAQRHPQSHPTHARALLRPLHADLPQGVPLFVGELVPPGTDIRCPYAQFDGHGLRLAAMCRFGVSGWVSVTGCQIALFVLVGCWRRGGFADGGWCLLLMPLPWGGTPHL